MVSKFHPKRLTPVASRATRRQGSPSPMSWRKASRSRLRLEARNAKASKAIYRLRRLRRAVVHRSEEQLTEELNDLADCSRFPAPLFAIPRRESTVRVRSHISLRYRSAVQTARSDDLGAAGRRTD